MIAYFHYTNKGQQPFTITLDPSSLQEAAEATNMDAEHVRFVKESGFMIQERGMQIIIIAQATLILAAKAEIEQGRHGPLETTFIGSDSSMTRTGNLHRLHRQ